jgi:hypothetical protein
MSFLHNTVVRFQILGEKLQGLDFTSAKLTPSQLGLDERRVFFAGPSGDRYTAQVFDDLQIQPTDAVIDIGSAKGSALRQLARYPFSRVDGIEISPELAAIAQRNFERLGPGPQGRRVNTFCLDATAFADYGRYNMFYLYSPFPTDVLAQVLTAILAQNTSGRERIVVYNNPIGHDTMLAHGFHLLRRYPDHWGNGINVYSSQADSRRLGRPS